MTNPTHEDPREWTAEYIETTDVAEIATRMNAMSAALRSLQSRLVDAEILERVATNALNTAAALKVEADSLRSQLNEARLDRERMAEATDEDVERIERSVGMGCGAWDMVDPKAIIEAAWRLAPSSTLPSPESERLDGAGLIAAERRRQVESEGWDAAHDDSHRRGELSVEAARYAVQGTDAKVTHPDDGVNEHWPYWSDHDKRYRHDEIRRQVIAGALIAAEIDRMLRDLALRSAIDAARLTQGER